MNAVDISARGLASRAMAEFGRRQVAIRTLAGAKSLDLRAVYGDVEIVIQDRQASRWIADAAVVAAEEGYSWFADAGATVWRLAPDQIVTPFMLGGSTSGDNRYALQYCLDYAAANGAVAGIHARFETSYPIYLPATGCVIDGAGGWIVNTNANPLDDVQHKLCLIPGNYSAQYYGADTLDFHACQAVAHGGQGKVTTAAPEDAAHSRVTIQPVEHCEAEDGAADDLKQGHVQDRGRSPCEGQHLFRCEQERQRCGEIDDGADNKQRVRSVVHGGILRLPAVRGSGRPLSTRSNIHRLRAGTASWLRVLPCLEA